MPYEQRSIVKTHIACRREESTTYTRRVGSNFSSFTKLTTCEELLVLLHVEIIGTGKVGTAREFECEFGVVQGRQDIWNDSLLIDVDA